jgi:redox-sensitive bicupin YhaK (pirin superfamily)
MSIAFSPLLPTVNANLGAGFSANRIVTAQVASLMQPVMGMDHFLMSDVTFAPHPHAGFSAVSYLFESSPGRLRNRDSLGNDFEMAAGGLIWTQAARGVVHDERPAELGKAVHGVQIFVNLSSKSKGLTPRVFRLEGNEVPVWKDDAGDRVRVVVGAYGGLRSPVVPAEPFQLLDIKLEREIELPLEAGWNVVLYVLSGEVALAAEGTTGQVGDGQAIALNGDGTVTLTAKKPAQVLVMAGVAVDEPIVSYGPFIMNTEAQVAEAVHRFQQGGMGHLEPLP